MTNLLLRLVPPEVMRIMRHLGADRVGTTNGMLYGYILFFKGERNNVGVYDLRVEGDHGHLFTHAGDDMIVMTDEEYSFFEILRSPWTQEVIV